MKIHPFAPSACCPFCGMHFTVKIPLASSEEGQIIEHDIAKCPQSGKKFIFRLPKPIEFEEVG